MQPAELIFGRQLSFSAPADRGKVSAKPIEHHKREPEPEPAPGWNRRPYEAQLKLAQEHEARSAQPKACAASQLGPRPRIYVYEVPPEILPPPTLWRYVRALKVWIERSAYYEPNPHCADYYLIPSHPQNRIHNPAHTPDTPPHTVPRSLDVGDYRMARLFAYLRDAHPFWNRTVKAGVARHFMLLPCDHGPGDCGFSRPILPNKYFVPLPGGSATRAAAKAAATRAAAKAAGAAAKAVEEAEERYYKEREIQRLWGNGYEAFNPASPARFVFFLQFNGWTDGLRSGNGGCLNCFQPGLDVRLPTPEGHECGPSCGLHHVYNHSSKTSWYIPTELQRLLLRAAAARSPTVQAALPSILDGIGEEERGEMASAAARRRARCLFSWHGAVRGNNNPTRNELMSLARRNLSNICVSNTAARVGKAPVTSRPMPSIPDSMLSSRFCFSPRGWDQVRNPIRQSTTTTSSSSVSSSSSLLRLPLPPLPAPPLFQPP